MDWTLLATCGVAFVVAAVGSTGGISGAFLLLPFQVSVLGFAGPAVTPTNHMYNVVAIPGGVFRYWREGRMLWPLAGIIALGTVPGVLVGSWIRIALLPDARSFKLFAGAVLLFIGSRLVSKILSPKKSGPAAGAAFGVTDAKLTLRALTYRYAGETFSAPALPLSVLTLIIGVVGGAYGIGGGAIIAPLLVSWWRLPIHTIAGATLFGTFLTSVVGVGLFLVLAALGVPDTMPNLLLGLALGVGGLCGTYAGARVQRFLPARLIEALLTLVVGGLGLSYVVGFFLA
jgi:hypothetical protein